MMTAPIQARGYEKQYRLLLCCEMLCLHSCFIVGDLLLFKLYKFSFQLLNFDVKDMLEIFEMFLFYVFLM